MTVRTCARCRQTYGEAVEGPLAGGARHFNAARGYAPFCSKRCADVDLIHWLKGEYVIDGEGSLGLAEEQPAGPAAACSPADGED